MLQSLQDIEQYSIAASDGDIGQVKVVHFDDHAWAGRGRPVNRRNSGDADAANRARATAGGP